MNQKISVMMIATILVFSIIGINLGQVQAQDASSNLALIHVKFYPQNVPDSCWLSTREFY